jgi:hypothetical protein
MAEVIREAAGTLACGPLAEERAAARAEILELARRQTEAMDEAAVAAPDPALPLLVTGHQPDLYHPGIWAKNFIVDAVCRRTGFSGLNLTVDSDLPSSRGVELPETSGEGWRRHPLVIPEIRPGVPWERQAPLGRAGWSRFLERVRAVLPAPLHPVLDDFESRVLESRSVERARTLADSLARARRVWEGRPSYLELDVSTLCATGPFYRFVASVLGRLEAFFAAHNDGLAAYRKARRIRSAANPVPDLRHRDDLWETPFWCVHPGGERGGLFLERAGGGWRVQSKDTTFGTLEDGDETAWDERLRAMMERGGAGLRPRAVTLTLFVRRWLADTFLHGVGGARYERASDSFASAFFAEKAAPWGVASATFCLTALGPPPEEDARALRRALRDLVHNPQRFVVDPSGVERKRALVAAFASAKRGERKALGEEVARENVRLRAALEPLERDLERRLAAAVAAEEAAAVTGWRGYPYFLFRSEQVRDAVEAGFRQDRAG